MTYKLVLAKSGRTFTIETNDLETWLKDRKYKIIANHTTHKVIATI
jgi:hypothetical protein